MTSTPNMARTSSAEMRPLSLEQLLAISGMAGVGSCGTGVIAGEIVSRSKKAVLITAAKGTRSEVSFATDLSERGTRALEGHRVWVAGVIRKSTQWTGTITRARVVHWPAECHLPGEHLTLSGRVEEQRVFASGCEAPPSGSWLVLARPIHVGRAEVTEVFVQGSAVLTGDGAVIHGRLDARHYGGTETPQQPYFALSGASNVGRGEPIFDGVQFLGAETGAHLRALVLERREMFDAPNVVLVLDRAQRLAFVASMGARVIGDNPFHGFSSRARIDDPMESERGAVRFDEHGAALSAATGAPLCEVARETPPGAPDDARVVTYFDVGTYRVYVFTGTGHLRRLQAVIRVPHDVAA